MPSGVLSAGNTTVKNTGKNPSLRGLTLKTPAGDSQGILCEARNGGDRKNTLTMYFCWLEESPARSARQACDRGG